MKKENLHYVIGVDGGGTKTVAALANLRGKILTQSRSGSSNPRNVGIKKAVLNITRAVKPLLKRKKGKITSVAIALPAIEEEYRGRKKEILKFLRVQKEIPKIFQGEVEIFSDQLVAFRAGTDEKDGVILIAGTGSVAHGWRKNRDVKASGWGWVADEGSAFWVGHKAIQVILKDLDQRGEKTLLTELAFKEFKVKEINAFLKKLYSENITFIIPRFSIICDKASQKGDRIAREIMKEAGRELALAANTVIKKLHFQKQKFPLVLVGSVFKTKIVFETMKREIKKIAPRAQFIHLKKAPVLGAIKLAIEKMR